MASGMGRKSACVRHGVAAFTALCIALVSFSGCVVTKRIAPVSARAGERICRVQTTAGETIELGAERPGVRAGSEIRLWKPLPDENEFTIPRAEIARLHRRRDGSIAQVRTVSMGRIFVVRVLADGPQGMRIVAANAPEPVLLPVSHVQTVWVRRTSFWLTALAIAAGVGLIAAASRVKWGSLVHIGSF